MIKFFLAVIFMGLVGINNTYADDIYDGRSDQELIRSYTQNWLGDDPISEKYIYNVIYVGMPKEEFVKLFTWNEDFEGTLRPYITKNKENVYYLNEPYYEFMKEELNQSNIANTGKGRVKFENGRLVKYEIQYRDKPPFIFLVWKDMTANL